MTVGPVLKKKPLWTPAYTPGDGQTSRVYSNNPVLHLYTLLNGQSHFTHNRIDGADANMSCDVIFNSVFYIEWDVHSHRRILCLVVKYNLDRD
jgi:hypothetical protein